MPFVGEIARLQRNAFHSWLNLSPTPEILIMGGREEGVREFADEYDEIRVVDVEYTKNDLPFFNSIYHNAQKEAKNDILCYTNADILHCQRLIEAVKILKKSVFKEWVAVGRRLDVDIGDFKFPRFVDIETDIKLNDLIRNGRMHGFSACDYNMFPCNLDWSHMPPFSSARPGGDTWINADTLERGISLINLDHDVIAIHQGTDRPFLGQGGAGRKIRRGAKDIEEFKKQCADNRSLAGSKCVGCNVATYFLKDGKIVSRSSL